MNTQSPFYIAARESGSTSSDLPLWASSQENPLALKKQSPDEIIRVDIESVPGAFQLLNLLSEEECNTFLHATNQMGYTEDAAVSLGRHIRHNNNLNWIIDETSERMIWQRIEAILSQDDSNYMGYKPLGLNQRFRFYRYETDDYFSFHSDGSWPGSKIIDGKLHADAFGDRFSLYTFLIYLNDDFKGGETQFMIDQNDPTKPSRDQNQANIVDVRTPAGGVLCFPHGTHPLHCLHSSAKIIEGVKDIIRTDVLFST
ncbi:hypothetical protein OO007_18780 [Cocleimonas sp. KMM 6892]|uniref:hypothetical protein n=1 Tax=unclassified Cocleimonas TaxID=2639732 RepID=UPI002DBDB505|nr:MULTISPECIES: hypothetical protein [unclassified Cocleimonas]MEB8434290.1 hypothetical protein [Cocleimonas sp. KMM 6892]MEC4717091.1 hypothetical protein [Cocleimonas sp. KMM 6895]MEC4746562.1 hypothetical protein [Cocleimonas sp. KMM 6896]